MSGFFDRLGTAWAIATYFVVPVLVVEKTGPIEALKRSTSIMRKTWGEAIGAEFGTRWIVFLGLLVALVPAVLGFVIGSAISIGVGIAVAVAIFGLVALISAALDGIIVGALYVYASDGELPEQFDRGIVEGAFG